jgi:hypothetical protein
MSFYVFPSVAMKIKIIVTFLTHVLCECFMLQYLLSSISPRDLTHENNVKSADSTI